MNTQKLLQIFNLPQVCVELNKNSYPGVLLEIVDIKDKKTEQDMKDMDKTDMDKTDTDKTDTLDKTDKTKDCKTHSIKTDKAWMSGEPGEAARESDCGEGDRPVQPPHPDPDPDQDPDPDPDPDHDPDPDPPHHRRGERERKSPRKFQDFVMF